MIGVIGSNMVDLVTYCDRMPKPGETIAAPDFAMGNGGKGANQAVAAASLGADVLMVSKVGDDFFADNTLANFEKRGINTKYVTKVPGVSSGVAPIFVDSSSQNSILIIKGANEHLLPEHVDEAAEDLKKCSLILLQLEIPLETVYYAIEFGKREGIPVMLNPAPADPDLDLEKVCQCAFFTPNETELATLTGRPVETEAQVLAAARMLTAKGLQNVIVTLGRRGSLWVRADGENFVPALQVQAVDTTGAGDSYIGAFAAIYEKTDSIAAAMAGATAYAALGVQGRGTQSSYATAAAFKEYLTALQAEQGTDAGQAESGSDKVRTAKLDVSAVQKVFE